jgi:flagellar motor switch protein FliN/FliY
MKEHDERASLRAEAILREFATVFDVPLQIAVEVGRLRLRVRDLMKLAPGTVIGLKKPAGEPFDICINGVAVARGEVILVEQASGVRIVDVQKTGSVNS